MRGEIASEGEDIGEEKTCHKRYSMLIFFLLDVIYETQK